MILWIRQEKITLNKAKYSRRRRRNRTLPHHAQGHHRPDRGGQDGKWWTVAAIDRVKHSIVLVSSSNRVHTPRMCKNNNNKNKKQTNKQTNWLHNEITEIKSSAKEVSFKNNHYFIYKPQKFFFHSYIFVWDWVKLRKNVLNMEGWKRRWATRIVERIWKSF